ncbi:hypothetical protein GCM10007978_25880 [Shewanella hanedai]|uniref:DUF3306 domain-containing protein n=1 Tax=Shewanella hanedai TaxID=25 RepID=A0A553JMP9_SHEHA|nr:DUF3306 domain-containing protein [Shewanella hanedai]TRY13748.1 DUF3306 domain-containing protein [Shewanella hanedai]GGI86962.1 hypothetical protein GCM10007978_25880 [Shewanella hanedai]
MSGFLSRWNLRRQKVEDEKLADEIELVADQAEPVQDLAEQDQAQITTESSSELQAEPVEEGKLLTADELPDPDKIEIGGSFASFMSANVDPSARSAALRALWKQPQYSEIDGLLEYALDYSNQPKLTPEHSAEIAKKVFRYVTKDEDKEAEEETVELAQDEQTDTDLLADTTEDILDANINEVSQNEPESVDDTKQAVS